MSFIKGFFSWVKGIFHKGSDTLETVALPTAITVTNALKGLLTLDSMNIIGSIAGSAGKDMENKLRGILDLIIPKLQLAQQFKGQDPVVILASVLRLVGSSDTITQTAFWIEFSGMVTHAFEDGKIDLAEAFAITKYFYENKPKS